MTGTVGLEMQDQQSQSPSKLLIPPNAQPNLSKGITVRKLTPLGWQRLQDGFSGEAPTGGEGEFWCWATEQGEAFQLAAYLIVGMLGGCESEFPGFNAIRADCHPVRMAWSLDDIRKALISDFLLHTNTYMR